MNKAIKILLIDDDKSLCRVLERQLLDEGFTVVVAHDGEKGIATFENNTFDVILTDLAMPGMDGLAVLKTIRRMDSSCIVIIITAYGTIENAIEACEIGADDYITKPFSIEQLRFVMEKALHFRRLENENISLKTQLDKNFGLESLYGQSVAMQEVYRLIQKVAPTDSTVLIQGESGTGKELVARAIHALSPRSGRPFVPVDCAAIPDALLESELFGHIKGAFTGAHKDRKGKFESAEKGTLFLDEIGDLKESLQAKLLRTLQEKQITKVGSDAPLQVNARIIAATNHDLAKATQESTFRQDLYYRLAVIVITIPPLRERREDIEILVNHFLQKYSHGRKITAGKDVLQALMSHDWPGNVRELENTIERAIILSDADVLNAREIAEDLRTPQGAQPGVAGKSLEQIERGAIEHALRETGGNQSKAAELLGIPRHVLLYRLKKWGIEQDK